MRRRRLVSVPASSANLGPGYDVLAAALELTLELEVEETGEFGVHSEVAGLPDDRSNLCVRGFELLHPADGLAFRIRSEIPVAAGLGSSAAAIVAGLCAADHMFELDAPLFALARGARGPPGQRGRGPARRLRDLSPPRASRCASIPPPAWRACSSRPDHRVSTAAARAAMPAEVPIGDAVHNVARASLLVLGLASDDLSLIGRGLPRPHPPAPARAPLPGARWRWWSGPRSWARWAPRSPAPGRPCCSGATGSRPGPLMERLRSAAGGRRRAPRDLRPRRRRREGAVTDRRRGACRRRGGDRRRRPGGAGAPAQVRRLDPAQGQARPGRDLRGGGAARGRGGDGAALPAGSRAARDRVRRPEGPFEARALLAHGGRGRPRLRAHGTRWTSCGTWRRRRRSRSSPTTATATCCCAV